MQVEKAQEFLRSCCRVCLTVENEMVDTVNIVENFNKSIAQLLLECADIQVFDSFDIIKLLFDSNSMFDCLL